MQKVTLCDNSSTRKTISGIDCKVKISLNSSDNDSLGGFAPLKVLGGGFSVTVFTAAEKNGWAEIIDTYMTT